MEVSPRLRPPASGGRRSAVLVLFAAGRDGPDHPDLLFIQRSTSLRRHAGQPAFPGGVIDAADAGPVAAALREAAEEVGVDPGGVEVVGAFPELFIPPTGFRVVPVLAWWRRPSAVAPVDPAEVAAVERISVSELADPAARLMMHRPRGIILPAFRVRGLLIWGMTAAVVDRLLALAGWERPWDSAVVDWPELDGEAVRSSRSPRLTLRAGCQPSCPSHSDLSAHPIPESGSATCSSRVR